MAVTGASASLTAASAIAQPDRTAAYITNEATRERGACRNEIIFNIQQDSHFTSALSSPPLVNFVSR
jgi:hypothetical protein